MVNKERKSKATPKQKLAGEFTKALKDHKECVILYALIKNEDILNSKYFKRYKNMEVIAVEGYEDHFNFETTRAYRITEDLDRRTANGEPDLYDKVYKFCWKKIQGQIEDNFSFNN